MIAIVDYGAGNLFSVKNACDFLGLSTQITGDAAALRAADGIILPGVGAFPDAMRQLTAHGLTAVLQEEATKKPLLGICLGMQMLFEFGMEFERTEGLGLLPGFVARMETGGRKLPHVG
ncbi:MAG: imidazole glycerol phosphate synthase subunit HisH, partial [Oscillospiraceae bacterium]